MTSCGMAPSPLSRTNPPGARTHHLSRKGARKLNPYCCCTIKKFAFIRTKKSLQKFSFAHSPFSLSISMSLSINGHLFFFPFFFSSLSKSFTRLKSHSLFNDFSFIFLLTSPYPFFILFFLRLHLYLSTFYLYPSLYFYKSCPMLQTIPNSAFSFFYSLFLNKTSSLRSYI